MRGFFPPPAFPGVPFSQQHARVFAVPAQPIAVVPAPRVQPASPTKETYKWRPRRERMKWPLAESIEVDKIVRKCDLSTVLFYTKQFTEANVGPADEEQFGSAGALNAFRILQLGAEYLMEQIETPPPEPEPMVPNEVYDRMMETARVEIQARDVRILEYEERFKQMREEQRQAQILLEKYKKKLHALKASGAMSSDEEPGVIQDNVVESTEDERASDLSEGEIDTTAVAKPTQIHSSTSDDEY